MAAKPDQEEKKIPIKTPPESCIKHESSRVIYNDMRDNVLANEMKKPPLMPDFNSDNLENQKNVREFSGVYNKSPYTPSRANKIENSNINVGIMPPKINNQNNVVKVQSNKPKEGIAI